MKEKKQRFPRLYINISNRVDSFKLDYYDNQYESDGQLKLNSTLFSSDNFFSAGSDKEKLYSLNKIEFQILESLIKKQKKVLEIYLKKNKKEQYKIVSSSLELLLEYKKIFSEWFSNNEIL